MFGQLDAKIDELRGAIVHIDPALEELAHVDGQVQEEIARFYSQTIERDDLLAERIDEIRRYLDTQSRDLRQIVEQRFDKLNARVDGMVDTDRELAYRLNMLEMRLDELREVDVKLRRELLQLHEARTRWRLDQIQAELEIVNETRRAAEAELAADRADRSERPTPR
jgi:chromosome segregation ATPase